MRFSSFFTAFFTAATLLASGCAPKNWDSEENGAFDPIEGVNREVYKFNKGMDFILFKPAAKLYQHFPPPIKSGVSNVFDNFGEPSNIVNNALQINGDATVNSTARFALNSTIGFFGLFDVASALDIPEHKTDTGITLRSYGMRNTMYFVTPFIGPGSFADTLGRGGDNALAPQSYIDHEETMYQVYAVGAIKTRADLLETTDLVDEVALDEYIFVRDFYEEQRLNSVIPAPYKKLQRR